MARDPDSFDPAALADLDAPAPPRTPEPEPSRAARAVGVLKVVAGAVIDGAGDGANWAAARDYFAGLYRNARAARAEDVTQAVVRAVGVAGAVLAEALAKYLEQSAITTNTDEEK